MQVAIAARGYTESVKDVALALIHDKLFSEAERIGEEYGQAWYEAGRDHELL
jgi:hypothetical protein